MSQIILFTGLHLLGILFSLSFKSRLPASFIGLTGFAWGIVLWGFATTFVIFLPIEPRDTVMLAVIVLIATALVILHVRRGTWQISSHQIMWAALGIGLVISVCVLSAIANFAYASPDSISLVLSGQRIFETGLNEWMAQRIADRNILYIAMYSTGAFVSEQYVFSLQPLLGLSLITVFTCIVFESLKPSTGRYALQITIASAAVLLSTYFFTFQMFYVHNSLPSALYLFAGMGTAWLGMRNDEPTWFVYAAISFLAFSLMRTEAPLFTALFFLILLVPDRLNMRHRLALMLPVLGLTAIWYAVILTYGRDSRHLGTGQTLMLIAVNIGMIGFLIFSSQDFIKRVILKNLAIWLLVGTVVMLIGALIYNPETVIKSLYVMIDNLLISPWWGISWAVLLILLIIPYRSGRYTFDQTFVIGFICFVAVLLAISAARVPYRQTWQDSANRMITHILPLVFFHLTMKYHRLFLPASNNKTAPK